MLVVRSVVEESVSHKISYKILITSYAQKLVIICSDIVGISLYFIAIVHTSTHTENTVSRYIMSSPQVSVACFQFKQDKEEYDDWIDDCQNEVDGQGAMWQLQLQPSPLEERPGGITIGTDIVTCYFGLTPSHGQPEGVERLETAKVTLVVRNQLGDAAYEYDIPSKTYDSSTGSHVQFDDFVKWSALKEMLIDGALILDAIIQYQETKRKSFLPNNPFKGNMIKWCP